MKWTDRQTGWVHVGGMQTREFSYYRLHLNSPPQIRGRWGSGGYITEETRGCTSWPQRLGSQRRKPVRRERGPVGPGALSRRGACTENRSLHSVTCRSWGNLRAPVPTGCSGNEAWLGWGWEGGGKEITWKGKRKLWKGLCFKEE